MAASFWGAGIILPQRRWWLQVTHLTFGTLLLHPACASVIARPQQGLRAQLCRASDCWICGGRSPLGVWFQCFGSKSLTAVSMHRAILPCSCLCGGSIPAVVLREPSWLLWLGSTFSIPPQGAAGACATVTRAARSEFVSCKQDVSQCC